MPETGSFIFFICKGISKLNSPCSTASSSVTNSVSTIISLLSFAPLVIFLTLRSKPSGVCSVTPITIISPGINSSN